MTISAPCRTAARLVAVVAMFTGVVALAPPGADAAGTLVVTKTADTSDGVCNADCSLREAIVASNALAGAETITFTGAGIGTITLGSPLPDITSDITIEGTGAGSVKIDGAGLHRAFIVQAAANLALRKLTVQNTRAESALAGGAVFSDGTVSIDGVSFVGNLAPANGGGAIWVNLGVTTVANSTFSGNSTGEDGGAIAVPNGGTLHAYNSTFTGNTAAGSAAAIYSSASSMTVVNSTIVGNTGAGAVYGYGTVTNSILAGNTGGDCANVNVTNSLVADGTCITPGVNGNRSGDAGLGALTGNPASYPLTATSQAVNAGSNAQAVSPGGAALTLDQNGAARVQQGTVDLGAVESPFTGIPQVTIGPASADVAEGAGTSLTISRSGASAVDPLAVKLGITRGSGTSGTDYALTGGAITAQTGAATVTIPAGSTSVTVNLAAAADAQDEVDELVTLALTADAAYTLGAPASSQVTIVDIDDSPTLSIGDVSITEGDAGTVDATFTVTQSAVSTLSVTVDYATSDATATAPDDHTATFGALTFAPGDTSKTITVAVTGDRVDEVDETFGVSLSAPTNATITDGTGTGTILDDDTAGVTVTPLAGLVTTEAGGTGTFTAALDSQPTSDVTVAVASSDTGEGTASPTALTFTATNWATPQTVTVTGVDDSVDDGDIAYEVGLTVTSDDDGYDGFEAGPVAVTNTDDDGAGVTVAPLDGLVTTEAGGTGTFTVVLESQPTGDVTVAVASSDTGEGTAAAADLTFTSANWNAAQTVTVTGVDDDVDDGDVGYEVGLTVASPDALYDGYETGAVAVTNTDDDTAGVTVAALGGLETTEAGGTATFTVVLDSQPTGDVTVAVASSDTSEGTAASSTFTPTNWATPQTVTVTGVDDAVDDGDIGYQIGLTVASADQGYDGLEAGPVEVTNTDDDTAGVTVTPVDGLATTEAGGTATFTVVLDSQPTGDVTVAVASSDTGEGTAAPATLTFAAANWATPQTVTVTGVDDAVDDGDTAYEIELTVTSSDDDYDGLEVSPFEVTNTDDDTAGVTVTPLDGLVTTEAGGTSTFTVVLDSEPTGDVSVASSDSGEKAAAPASLIFTPANWATPQTVTVTGVDDGVDGGDTSYEVELAITSTDVRYDGFEAGPVSVTNIDDDTAGVTVTPLDGLVTTEAGGTSTFTVVLDSEPTDEVTVEVASTDTDEGTVAAAMLTFTPEDWATPQTVTATGVDDAVDDGDVAYEIDLTVASSDALYDGFDAGPIAAANIDDDVETAEPPVITTPTPPAPTPVATPPTSPPTSPASVLPRTGTDLALSLSLATATLALGLALVRLSRRRRAV